MLKLTILFLSLTILFIKIIKPVTISVKQNVSQIHILQ